MNVSVLRSTRRAFYLVHTYRSLGAKMFWRMGVMSLCALFVQCTPAHNTVGARFHAEDWSAGRQTRKQAREGLGEPARIVDQNCEEYLSHNVLDQETTLISLCFSGDGPDATLTRVNERRQKLLPSFVEEKRLDSDQKTKADNESQ